MKTEFQTKRLVTCALLTAIAVLLSGPLSVPVFPLGIYSLKIGLGSLPVILSGILFGPVYGGIAGGLTDILQFLISPKGAYVPWFTIIGAFTGLLPALFFRSGQRATLPRLFLAVSTSQVFCSVICNTALLVLLYGVPLETILPLRVVNQAVSIPVYVFLLYLLLPLLKKVGVSSMMKIESKKE